MKVLLLERVINIGKKGEIKDVKPGFAANCLFPKGLAVELTPAEEKKMLDSKKKDEKHRLGLVINRHEIVDKLQGKKIEFFLKVCSTSGKVFGGIGEGDIISKIKKDFKVELSKKHIDMPDGHIKKTGEKDIFIKLGKDSIAKITVVIKAEK